MENQENSTQEPLIEPKQKQEVYISVRELKSAFASFSAILPPVFWTMVLSAFVVLYVTPLDEIALQESPLVFLDEGDAGSGAEAVGFGLVNALIIVGAITGMTFLIVLCLYFGCEKLFAGYLFVALILLMGFTTGTLVVQGLEFYSVPVDYITLSLFFYNYAITGAICIFSFEIGLQGKERIIPYSLTQVYLVLISVVMAWLVTTIFPEFTIWALLICLALYDLCAVLTPCGPLNLLIKVVTKRTETAERRARERGEEVDGQQRQMIPGLLYEVNTGKSKGTRLLRNDAQTEVRVNEVAKAANQERRSADPPGGLVFAVLPFMAQLSINNDGDEKDKDEDVEKQEAATEKGDDVDKLEDGVVKEDDADEKAAVSAEEETDAEKEIETITAAKESDGDLERLKAENEAKRAEMIAKLKAERAELERQIAEAEAEDSNLKLGLGDFVFYSVLTAKSAEFGFTAFVGVGCCVLCGLCGTLVLLSVFQKALPALPISIALGVVTYLVLFRFTSPFADGLLLSFASI